MRVVEAQLKPSGVRQHDARETTPRSLHIIPQSLVTPAMMSNLIRECSVVEGSYGLWTHGDFSYLYLKASASKIGKGESSCHVL